MEDPIDGSCDMNEFGYVVVNELEAGSANQVRDVVGVSRNQVVEADNLVSRIHQTATKVVSEETRAARPEAYNLLGIYAALSEKPIEAVLEEFSGTQFSHFKAVLTDLAVAVLGPIGAEMQRLCADPGAVDAVLHDGAERARAIAEPVLDEVYDVVGFLRP